ncbi:2-succinyl-5-enolpyruvyl-6-hydroxy-3-cyclohexene-1-carboxylic-acid synthase [Galactobacter valiniphilus]|uniref:2-succinyl-5-enolpyruvyl-6-hydroxy-3-cyclohexene-1-carboxylate synthase n=1 Tax=Galactobacter valiniphilus TaxID=2676122 RepID=A0A399JM73_9MICC|nr:2-succinyl-5-enolpyruvyl-6-hydroxy-3-cyclohexene-1-carboxylic-acid synthase [Galactobacter valiniphilus]RII43706.1 2-succinyl-5-enolpyruvyl-6-hydroxy-3-cyclohexene-1-carboxylic-acid synthase [Galactobacter valiniphilus]
MTRLGAGSLAPAASPAPLEAMEAARLAVTALVDGGVPYVVLCPGSRSAPLAYALAEAELRGELEVMIRLDERDAGFLAVGLAAACGAPVAIVTTSGTAVGELVPAIMEANHAGLPLLAVTADRPEELHGTGSNQTTVQAGLFGEHVRASLLVEAGEDPTAAVRAALLAAEGLAPEDAVGVVDVRQVPRGPVQVDLAFRDPLTPPDDAALAGLPPVASRPDLLTELELLERDAEAAEGLAGFAESMRAAALRERRTVVVAGHGAGAMAADFAAALGLPLLAEPSSDARFGPTAVGAYQFLLPAFAGTVEAVVLFGRPTLSRPVAALLNRDGVDAAMYLTEPSPWFTPGRRRERVISDLHELAAFAGHAPGEWLAGWLSTDAEAREAMELVLAQREGETGRLTGPALAATVWEALDGPLVLGSSRPVRDMDIMAAPRSGRGPRVFANRGLAGIDGTLATAAGVALAERRRTVALMGDVTFLHDAGGLLLPTFEREPRLDVIVAQDDGGTIFSTLEHGAVAERGAYRGAVTRYFRTPHGLDLAPIAQAYGWDATTATTHQAVRAWLAEGSTAGGRRLLEVPVERRDPRGLHRALAAAAAAALD